MSYGQSPFASNLTQPRGKLQIQNWKRVLWVSGYFGLEWLPSGAWGLLVTKVPRFHAIGSPFVTHAISYFFSGSGSRNAYSEKAKLDYMTGITSEILLTKKPRVGHPEEPVGLYPYDSYDGVIDEDEDYEDDRKEDNEGNNIASEEQEGEDNGSGGDGNGDSVVQSQVALYM
ncbi:hypothetical protein BO70DRAFT_399749 [Aspergillus heteromorphus CBS 117.55]|uniref:Uncharacterized protein n=1 Tax=Aspergillus heteromorphus CBS 117.55 TaxID=1448321 RepID=A0A317V7Z6_9EURO|nr:uncharacterized protein BO70DRAFT_399749 [Aspergillus heteromorphus CBS 117.55]PWY70504.1 hypothetical protein BO70DRAFT_399749 [Aspergillus heteromorphus CBS 117.55]